MGGAGWPPDGDESSVEVMLSEEDLKVVVGVVVLKMVVWKWIEVLKWC